MSLISLDPVFHHDRYTDAVVKELIAYLKDVLFDPINDILEVNQVRLNQEQEEKKHSALWSALMAGLIWYTNGVFTGAFSAAISRELRALGARKTAAGFALAHGEIPLPLRAAINLSSQRSEQVHQALITTLTAIALYAKDAPTGIPLINTVDNIVDELQEQFTETVAKTDKLPSVPKLPTGERDEMARALETATSEAIRNFTVTQAQDLRAKVRENIIEGARIDRLAKIVESQQGVAQRRAKGIAEFQVAHLIATFREITAGNIGASRYVWVTQHDERVRDDHRQLDGKTFAWDNPPITNRSTGARNHPGGDKNCRCVARPVLNLL